jgi:hypothetical protein
MESDDLRFTTARETLETFGQIEGGLIIDFRAMKMSKSEQSSISAWKQWRKWIFGEGQTTFNEPLSTTQSSKELIVDKRLVYLTPLISESKGTTPGRYEPRVIPGRKGTNSCAAFGSLKRFSISRTHFRA